jgi:hypothetical protein
VTANRKDLICGLVFVVIGLLFAVGTRDLDLGTATRMGPGYFPLVLCSILILIGLIIAGRALGKPVGELSGVPWRAILLIVPAIMFFGYSVRGVGLFPAVFVVALAASFSSSKMSVPFAFALSAALSAFCAGVFYYGLGVPLQLFGPWVKFW